MVRMNSNSVEFYRDSRRPQGWGGFFLAIWMAIYIGGALSLWIIATGALLTMAVMAAIIIKFRPKQLAARWDGKELLEHRFILPPKHHRLSYPPKLVRYEDDVAGLQFSDSQRRHEVLVVFDQQLQQQLIATDIEVEDQRQ